MTTSTTELDVEARDAETRAALEATQDLLGATVVSQRRQARWRPAWYFEIEAADGTRSEVYFRGARTEVAAGADALRREYRLMELLTEAGLPLPELHGFNESPPGIVMERLPGRFNLARAADEAERRAVLDHFIELMVEMHRLPVEPFEAAGFEAPQTADAVALGDLPDWIAGYRASKRRPEPAIEFAIDWLRRNIPEGRDQRSILAGDAGQFMFDEGRVTGLIDLELGCIGDPAADLGALLSRDLSEPFGDLSTAIVRYGELAGAPVDRRVVLFHAIRFGLVTPLACSAIVADPPPSADLIQYLTWYLVYLRCPLELIAHLEGIEVEPVRPPAEASTSWSVAHDALGVRLQALGEGLAGHEAYRVTAVENLATYLRLADRLGPAIEAADLDEAEALLGDRPTDIASCDAALETIVAANDGEHDAALLGYFIRRLRRAELLVEPVAGELSGAQMQTLDATAD